MTHKPVTQKDIAHKLGLDHSTVSLALRNSSKISEAKRKAVQEAALEMGYSVNAAAANLAKHRSTSSESPVRAALAWLNCWPDPKKLRRLREFELYWEHAKEAAERFGYSLEEFIVEQGMTLGRVEKIMQARGIQGILLPPHPKELDFQPFDWSQFSVLRFGRSVQYPATHLVTADQMGNMRLAFDEVSKRGYNRIAMVDVQVEESWSTFDAGFLKAQEAHGIKDRLSIFHMNRDDPSLNVANCKAWLERERPDAVIAATAGVTSLLEAAGYDIGVNIGLAAMSVLDTRIDAGIYQNSEEIGRVAALALISQIQDNDIGIPKLYRQTLVPGVWVDGRTLPHRSALKLS
ncbi:MAG: LacI family DNA-binding transcriptional regulator [Lentimonas sp.]